MKDTVTDLQRPASLPKQIRSRLLLGGVGVIGFALTLFATIRADHSEETQIAENFRILANYQMAANLERVRLIEELMAGLRRAVTYQNNLTRAEFDGLCADIFKGDQGFMSLQWVQNVADSDRAKVEAGLRSDYGYPITFKSRTADQSFSTSETRDSYWVIRHAFPFEPNAVVLGYDLNTAPTSADLQHAAETGQSVVSAPFRLAQSRGEEEEVGVVFIAPVVRHGPTGDVLRGFVQGVFRASAIFAPTVLPENLEHALYRYLDHTDPTSPPVFLFATTGEIAGTQHLSSDLGDRDQRPRQIEQEILVGGRKWLFTAQADQHWLNEQGSLQPQVIFVGGLVITSLVFLLLRGMVKRAHWVEKLVEDRTQELLTQQGELRAIIDNSPNAIWIKDLKGRYLIVNQEMCDIYNRSAQEIIGQRDDLFYPPDVAAEMQAADHRSLESESHILVEGEYTVLGEKRYYYTVKFPVRRMDGEPFGVGGIATDVTNVKRVEAQLVETQKLESLGVLAGGIAHDFNNLLTGMLGNASLISHDLPPDSEIGQCAREIESAAKRAGELCRQMLAYSGRGRFVVERLNLSRAVSEIVPLLRSSIGSRIDLRLELADHLPPVQVDPAQIQQIVMNLVINASEALPEGRGWVNVSTAVKTVDAARLRTAIGQPDLPAGEYISFIVRDNGSGIDPANLRRIFDPFFTTKFTGRGLGLSAVLGIVRSHKGALLVDSTFGAGTTFELLLPTATTSPSPSPIEQPKPAVPASLPGLRVLLVEDETSVSSFVSRVLSQAGTHVVAYLDGARAVAAFNAEDHDLAVVDLTLPGLEGWDVVSHLRAAKPGIPVLLISGYSEQEAVGDRPQSDGDGFLQKPFSAEALLEQIHRLKSRL